MMTVAGSSWGGLGWLWIPICALMMIGCMVMMGGGMMRHGEHDKHEERGWRGWYSGQRPEGHDLAHRPESAEQILADRLARGEIDVAEYNRLLIALHPNGELDPHKAGTPGE